MASPSQSHLSTQPAPLRLPKLTYRNKSSDTESINTVSTDVSRTTISTNVTSPLQSTFCPSPREPPSDLSIRHSSARPTTDASSTAPRTPKNPSKKKSSFFSGIFGAKEPSAQAFADYEKQLLKNHQGRSNHAGIPGVSSAKLPPTVPKVNSRWDGVPQSLKEKEKEKQQQELAGRKPMIGQSRDISSSRSAETSVSQRRQSRGTLGASSTHSNSSNALAELYGWESKPVSSSSSAIVDFASEQRPSTSRLQTSHSAPPPSDRPPPLERSTQFPPRNLPLPSARPNPYFEQPSPSLSTSLNPPSHSNSPALTPYESLPVTPDAPSPITPLTSPILQATSSDGLKTTVVEAPTRTDEVLVRSAGVNILGPPATAKRNHKYPPYPSNEIRPKTSASDMLLPSILKKQQTKETPSPRPALASYFPSPNSTSPAAPVRRNSAHERLGLGVSVKNQDAAPWLSLDPAAADAVVNEERVITPTPSEGDRSLRRKNRMSLFKK